MFSSILEFFQRLQEVKLRKQKRETKKEIKKEENKILKKKDDNQLGTARDKAKKTKPVKESNEKENKLRLKIILLRIIKWIVQMIETFISFLIGLIGVMGFFIILIVIVLMIAIYGLLHIDLDVGSGEFFDNSSSYEDCVQGGQVLQNTGYNLSMMPQLMGTMTEHQKNLVRFLGLYQDYLSRDDVWRDTQYVNEIKNVIGADKLFNFMHGFSFCETGGYFTVLYRYDTDKDILKYSTTHDAAYCFLGLVKGDTFDTYYSGFPSAMSTDSFIDYVKATYIPDSSDTRVTDNNYAPYGAATQISLIGTESLRRYDSFVEDNLPKYMDAYGIQANRDKLMAYCKLFMAAAYYHSLYDNHEDLLNLWCALWASTAAIDSNRGFDNIEIVYDVLYLGEQMYGEPEARKFIFGTDYDNNNLVIKWDEKPKSVYFKINGKAVDSVLLKYVRDNCGNETLFMEAVNNYLIPQAGKEVANNFHYGLVAYLITPKIIKDLGGTMPVVSGGYIEDCDCYEISSGSIQGINTSNIKTGEPQGTWSEKILNVFKSIGASISKYFGRTKSIESPNNTLTGLGITYESWRQQSKWKVPYMLQNNADPEGSQNSIPSDWVSSLGSLGNAGCHIYMYSYMASALTGRVINPTEMTVALRETGGITSTGLNVSSKAVGTFRELGLKAVSAYSGGISGDISDFTSYFGITESELRSTSSESVQKVVDAILNKNGIVGMAGAYGYFTENTNHYVVITEKTSQGYKVMGYNSTGVYPASYWAKAAQNVGNSVKTTSGDVYNWEYIYKAMSSNTTQPSYNHQKFYAYNPNLGAIQQSSVEFEKFLFIGDSHTVGLQSILENAGHIVRASAGSTCGQWIGTTTGTKVMGNSSDSITLSDIKQEDINGIVVKLGSNSSTSQEDMKTFLAELKGVYPNVPIFVQKVFPVGANYKYINVISAENLNAQISTFNADIEGYCNSNNFYFIDTTANLVTSEGYLKNSDALEGIHISTSSGDNNVWWSNIQSAVQMKLRTDVVGNINTTTVECVSNGKSTYNVSAEHMTSNESDLPGGFARPYSIVRDGVTYNEPIAPVWNSSLGENPYEVTEYFYAFDKNTGYRLGMWPKDFDLSPVSVSKTYQGMIWPCSSSMQGVGYEHEGADLHAKCFTPIYAPADGTLTKSDWGRTVNRASWESAYTIDFTLDSPITYKGQTIRTLWYGHLVGIRYRVNSGDSPIHVKQGELIGWVGFANAPHLHITLDYNVDYNTYIDSKGNSYLGSFITKEIDEFYEIGRGEYREAGK